MGTRSARRLRSAPAGAADPEGSSPHVWYPDGADGPFPLIVFNHGQQGEPHQYAPQGVPGMGGRGYVVPAPRHPLTVRGGPGALFANDILGEIGDVPFTITSIGEELHDLVDMDSIAVAGHSSGAIVASQVGFNTCCHDDRVDAVSTGHCATSPSTASTATT